MRLSFDVGTAERHRVTFVRWALLEHARFYVDRVRVPAEAIRAVPSILPCTAPPGHPAHCIHGSVLMAIMLACKFEVGVEERHVVRVEYERPIYRIHVPPRHWVYVDRQLAFERRGY